MTARPRNRGLLKYARTSQSITAALREGGVDELTARLGAEVGLLAFGVALGRWMKANDDQPFAPLAAALSDLQARMAELDPRVQLFRLTWPPGLAPRPGTGPLPILGEAILPSAAQRAGTAVSIAGTPRRDRPDMTSSRNPGE